MKQLLRLSLIATLLGVTAALLHAAPAAPPAPATPGSIGVVDMDKIQSEYKGFQEGNTYLNNFRIERLNIYQDLQQGQFLTLEQFTELQRLAGRTVKINPTRIAELLQLSKVGEEDYTAIMEQVMTNLSADDKLRLEDLQQAVRYTEDVNSLQQEYDGIMARAQEKLPDADKARLQVLQDNTQKVGARLDQLANQYNKEINDEKNRIQQLLKDQVEQALATTANNQKLSIVLNKQAALGQNGSLQLVMWGGTEITDVVLKQLNDAFKPELFKPKA